MPHTIELSSLIKYMESDKKKKGGELYIAELESIGKSYPKTVPVPRSLIERVLAPAF